MLPTVIFGFIVLSLLYTFPVYLIGVYAFKSNSPLFEILLNLFHVSKPNTSRSINGIHRKKRCTGGLNAIDELIIFSFYYVILGKY